MFVFQEMIAENRQKKKNLEFSDKAPMTGGMANALTGGAKISPANVKERFLDNSVVIDRLAEKYGMPISEVRDIASGLLGSNPKKPYGKYQHRTLIDTTSYGADLEAAVKKAVENPTEKGVKERFLDNSVAIDNLAEKYGMPIAEVRKIASDLLGSNPKKPYGKYQHRTLIDTTSFNADLEAKVAKKAGAGQ